VEGPIVNLSGGARADPRSQLTGAWREIRTCALRAGESERLTADSVEHLVYVLAGRGTMAVAGDVVEVSAGVAATIVRGDEVVVTSSEGPMELFVVTLDA
jgi:quercetin dioxygenase-like cupin family protein